MADYNTIRSISQQLGSPSAEAGNDIAESITARFPYFLPSRYITAAQKHAQSGMSSELLTSMHTYTGNWLLFCDHLAGVKRDQPMVPELEEAAASIDHTQEPEHMPAPEEVLQDIVTHTSADPELVEQEERIATSYPMPQEDALVEEQQAVADEEQHEEEISVQEMETTETGYSKEAGALDNLVTPLFAEDYFMQQGVKVSNDMPEDISVLQAPIQHEEEKTEEDRKKSLMVMMSFTEWLVHFKHTSDKHKSEQEDKKAMRTMWQKEKLAAAMEEENDEIPENVFEMAVNSITQEEDLASEPLAEIYVKQQKYDKAIEMYRKLSLRNPQKNAYFARKIEEILKDKQL